MLWMYSQDCLGNFITQVSHPYSESMLVSIQEVSIFVHSGVSVTAKSMKIRSDSANPPAMQGTSGQISLHENGYSLNTYKSRVSGEAGYCFFKGKIFPLALKKMRYSNLSWLGAMEVSVEGMSFIYYDKTFIEILAPCLERKPYLNFAFIKRLSSRSGL
jgi:hypothetical protein